jgi:O-succinylbenzoic acid--CoA ligase
VRAGDWIAERAAAFPERLAVEDPGTKLTYSELDAAVARRAQELVEAGAVAGATVPVEQPASADFAVELHALNRLGAVAFPLDPRLAAAERRAALEAAGHEGGEELLCRILTSGSTGTPRAIGLTPANFLWSAAGSALNLGVEPADRWLCCLPLFHVAGVSILTRSAIYGTTAVVHDGFDPDHVARALAEDEITLVSLVATQLARLLDTGGDVSRPRAILLGGGPLPLELLERATAAGATVVQTYGMTETCSQVATLAPADARRKLGSAGRPLLTAKIEIDDGEIVVSGPTVAPGSLGPDDRLHTGDLGEIDDDGFLWVTGRKSEIIVSGGENVMAAEVEAVLLRHPTVADVAVVGRPDSEWQEAVTAIVVPAEGESPDEGELHTYSTSLLAPFKVPKHFEFVEELPRTAAGKLKRADL